MRGKHLKIKMNIEIYELRIMFERINWREFKTEYKEV